MKDIMTLAELAERSGVPGRTVRFYIARGLVPGPRKAGRGAAYDKEHIETLQRIRRLQGEGRTLAEIASIVGGVGGGPSAPALQAPTAWWSHAVANDVTVWVRADSSPWRLNQISRAIAEMASRLSPSGRADAKEDHHGDD